MQFNEAALSFGSRAAHLFLTKQLWCTAAVLLTCNRGLGGGMPDELAIRLTSGLGDGLSGSGCTCGALSGGVLVLGLFFGSGRMGPYGNRTTTAATRQLHERFKREFGATCCRVLTRSVRSGSKAHYEKCSRYTALCTQWAAEMVLHQQPQQFGRIDWNYLQQRENMISARLKIAAGRLML